MLTVSPRSNVFVMEHFNDPAKRAILLLPPETVHGGLMDTWDLSEWRTTTVGQIHRVLPTWEGKGCGFLMDEDLVGKCT